MNSIKKTILEYQSGNIEKPEFIKRMYENHHQNLFDYSEYLHLTNIKKIEIHDDGVIMTSRDKGVKVYCPKGDFRIAPVEILNFFDYEKCESDMMENLIADGDTFFDIGANIGWYSINIATSRRASKIYAFEPIPSTFDNLKRNLALNSSFNVEVLNFGFSDCAGTFPFYFYSEGSGNASSSNLTGRADVKSISCEVRTFDEFINQTNVKVNFIKCDVEGAELLVFKGAIKSIERDKPIVLSEILRKWSEKFNYNPNEIFDFFRNLGYRSFTVKNGKLIPFTVMNELTIETNFFFLHPSNHSELLRKYEFNVDKNSA